MRHAVRIGPWIASGSVGLAFVIALWFVIWGLMLKVNFGGGPEASWQSTVGTGLIWKSVVAGLVVIAGIGAATLPPSERRWIGPLLAAAAALTICGFTYARAHQQLHPSFADQLAAVRRFEPPPGAVIDFTQTNVSAQRETTRVWHGRGQGGVICPRLEQELFRWADRRTIRVSEQLQERCTLTARRGPDTVILMGSFGQPGATNEIVLQLRRPSD